MADGPVSAALLYGITALSIGGNYTPGLILIAERFPVGTRGRATGFFLAATSIGYAASLFVTGAVLSRFGWRATLLACSLGPVLGAAVALWTVWGTPTRIHPRQAGQGFVSEFLRNPAALLLTVGYTCHSWELLGMWAWTPAFLSASLVLQGQDLARATGGGARLGALFHLTGLSRVLHRGPPLGPLRSHHGDHRDARGEHGVLPRLRVADRRAVLDPAAGGPRLRVQLGRRLARCSQWP